MSLKIRVILNTMVLVSFGIFAVLLLIPLAQSAETRWWPVTTPATFTEVEGGFYAVSFEKIRQCELVGVYWHDGFTWVRQGFGDQWSRPTGNSNVSAWLTPPTIDPDVHEAVAHHRCHPFWVTRTNFVTPG